MAIVRTVNWSVWAGARTNNTHNPRPWISGSSGTQARKVQGRSGGLELESLLISLPHTTHKDPGLEATELGEVASETSVSVPVGPLWDSNVAWCESALSGLNRIRGPPLLPQGRSCRQSGLENMDQLSLSSLKVTLGREFSLRDAASAALPVPICRKYPGNLR